MGIKHFVKKIYTATKEREMIPIEHKTSYGEEFGGKVAWIAGGSGGIGLAIAKGLLESGCKVIISGTNSKKLSEIKETLNTSRVQTLVLDFNEVDTFKKKCKEANALFERDIDIFICATGIHVDREGLDFLNVKENEFNSIMNTNLRGTFFICQEVSKHMVEKKIKGHILIISSQSALEPAWSPYRISKLAISGLIKGMAQRLIGHGIVVNGIGPGPTATSMQKNYDGINIYTPLNPIQRYTMPEEVAEVAKMLVSPLGDTIVGDTIYMSGGRGIIELR